MIKRIGGRLKGAVRRLIVPPTTAQQATLPQIPTAELVARQFSRSGYRRLDLFIMYAAIADVEAGSGSGLDLLEKLLSSDAARRDTDVALLALLRRGRLSESVYMPLPAVVDTDLRLIANMAGLAAALYRSHERISVRIWKPRETIAYNTDWLIRHGFTPAEIGRIDEVRAQVYRRLGLADLPWEAMEAAQQELRQHLDAADVMHGLGSFYQSCEELAICGQRPTSARFSAYGLESLLDPDQRLLDIGCNCGFLALECARHVKQVHGFDINPRFIAIGNAAKRVLGRRNCELSTSSFEDFRSDAPFDVIFSFAVHHWIGQPIPEYAERLKRMLNPGGMVLVESQDVSTHDADWDAKLSAFCSVGFEPVASGTLCDDGVRARRHVLLRDTR
jgi:2-polyprenyl-3-methyl-5-hydroxy-6-metoxy-1,4-benzoquinol methylase